MRSGIAFDLTQDLEPVDFREFEIEQDQRGLFVDPRGELSPPVQVVQRVGAVANVNDFVGDLVRCEGVENQLRVARAVLDEENALECRHVVASGEPGNAAVVGSRVK